MAQQLVIDGMRCVEETDEVGSDDVYIVIFRGDPKPPFGSNVGVHGPGQAWSDFDTGELEGSDVPIAMFFPDAVYVIMLVEEDNARDISGSEVIGAWKSQCGLVWRGALLPLQLSGKLPPSPAQTAAAAQNVAQAMLGLASLYMELPKGNDDAIGNPQQVVVSSGQATTLTFKGDGGHYRIRFKVV
jgi:hypothetical protein